MKPKYLLIDGDVLAFQVTLTLEKSIHWGDDWWTRHCDLKACRELADILIAQWKEELGCDRVLIAWSDATGKYFRKDIHSGYKAHRKSRGSKPICYWPLKEYLCETYKCREESGLEGDDVLGIWATSKPYMDNCVIASIDKDMKTIPTKYYNIDTEELDESDTREAYLFFLSQALMGDKADGYAGCPKVGPVKAAKLLANVGPGESYWDAVLAAFEAAGLDEEEALRQARLARILHAEDWDDEKKEVKLWTPMETSHD